MIFHQILVDIKYILIEKSEALPLHVIYFN